MEHKLKIEENYLRNLVSGKKKAEIRFNDRDYQVGDILRFLRNSPGNPVYFNFKITHVHSGVFQ